VVVSTVITTVSGMLWRIGEPPKLDYEGNLAPNLDNYFYTYGLPIAFGSYLVVPGTCVCG